MGQYGCLIRYLAVLCIVLSGGMGTLTLAAETDPLLSDQQTDEVWGDVNCDGEVTNFDALIVLEYCVGNDVGEYRDGVEAVGDVDANGEVTAADAYVIMSRHVDPDNPALPERVGQPVGSVSGGAPADTVFATLYRTMDIAVDGDVVSVAPRISVAYGRLGSAMVTVQWSPGDYAFDGVGLLDGLVSYNDDLAANGSVAVAGMTFDPAGTVVLPSVHLRRLSPQVSGNISLKVTEASIADTFEIVHRAALVHVTESNERPRAMTLGQNAPNPFNPETVIRFQLPERMPVRFAVYSVTGQLVQILGDDVYESGSHQVVWDGRSHDGAPAAAGVYFYRLETPQHTITKRMILLR